MTKFKVLLLAQALNQVVILILTLETLVQREVYKIKYTEVLLLPLIINQMILQM